MTDQYHSGLARQVRLSWAAADPHLKRRLVGTYVLLVGFNVVVWLTLVLSSLRYPLLMGLAPLAYGFGLRHAVDPDHLAAIDNTTRKLMQDGKRPIAVGFFFSLGHATVVFLLSLLIALSTAFVRANLPEMRSLGVVIGTSVSGGFLLLIGLINMIVLAEIYRTWRRARATGEWDEGVLDEHLANRGLLARVFRPLLKSVRSSRQMYGIGFLFGLGFDTASEVGILGLSATAGAGGMPVWFILLLPLLFVAGMALVDTTDGVAMLGAYGWAYVRPVRKLYYNLNITLLSVVIALFIGTVELLQVLRHETGLSAPVVNWVNAVPLSNLGYYILGMYLLSWLVSAAVFNIRRADRFDESSRSALVSRPERTS